MSVKDVLCKKNIGKKLKFKRRLGCEVEDVLIASKDKDFPWVFNRFAYNNEGRLNALYEYGYDLVEFVGMTAESEKIS